MGASNRLIKAPLMQLALSEPQAFYVSLNKTEPYVVPAMQDRSMCAAADLQTLLPEIRAAM